MKSSVFLPLLISCAGLALSQGTPTPQATQNPPPASQKPSTPATPPAPVQLKARGPEAVAQQDPNRVVATIGGKPVTAQQALSMLKTVPADQRRALPNLETLIERVYMIDQLSDEATKLKLEQQPAVKDQLEFNRATILAQAFINRLTSNPGAASDAAKAYYDSHPDEFDQAKISGIFVSFAAPGTPSTSGSGPRTEEDARQKADDLEKKIKGGADFTTLARAESDDQKAAARGGDLGILTPSAPNAPADFKTAVFKLQTGQVSEPIRVQGGFYIIKVVSRTRQPFEEARSGILVKQEFDKFKIQVQDPDFFNASSAPTQKIPSLEKPGGSQPVTGTVKPQVIH